MGRLLLAVFLLCPVSVFAQIRIDMRPDEQIRALNAVFAFRTDLGPDSTVIARCRVPGLKGDTTLVRSLDARARAVLAEPMVTPSPGPYDCAVFNFADPKHRVIWIEDVMEVRRSSSIGMIPEFRKIQYEVMLQVLAGPSYREFQRYTVEATGIRPSGNGVLNVAAWRVTEYRLLGWDFHWGDNLGHGSSIRISQ